MIVYLSKHYYSMHLASSHLKVELCQTVFLDDVFDRREKNLHRDLFLFNLILKSFQVTTTSNPHKRCIASTAIQSINATPLKFPRDSHF